MTMILPPLDTVRPEVAVFARLMELKLRQNDHKGGWKNWCPNEALVRLREEANEVAKELTPPRCSCREINCEHALSQAFWKPDPERTGMEAADVANFAMMIADMAGAFAGFGRDMENGIRVWKIGGGDGEYEWVAAKTEAEAVEHYQEATGDPETTPTAEQVGDLDEAELIDLEDPEGAKMTYRSMIARYTDFPVIIATSNY